MMAEMVLKYSLEHHVDNLTILNVAVDSFIRLDSPRIPEQVALTDANACRQLDRACQIVG